MSGAMSVEMILRLVDQATAPLRGVVAEVEKLDKATKDLGASTGGGKVKAAVWAEQQQAIKKTQEEARALEAQYRRVETAQRAMVDAAIARELAHGAKSLIEHGAKAGASGAHSEVSLETQGNSVEEIREIQDKAADLSRQFRAFDKTKIETMLGDAKTFVGSLHHAMEAMPDILKLRTIQQGQHGHSSDEEFNSLIKALEVGGVTADAKKMHERLETFAKIMNVFKETIHPEDFSSFYNQAGIAARTLSDRFMRGAGAHLMQEMHGGGTGNAIDMFMQAIEAGTMQPKAMEQFDKLGLLDESKVRRKANKEIRWIDPGAVKGSDLARTDPDRWVDEVLRGALEKLPQEKRDEAELAMFSNKSARKLVDKVLNQKSVVDKDRAQVEAAPGLDAADIWMKKDPSLAAHSVGAQFDNMMRDAGKGLMTPATGLLNWLSQTEAGLTKVTQEHPAAATTAGLSAAAAGFWASLKLAQAAMMKAGSWWGQGAGTTGGGAATGAAEAAVGAAPKAGGMGAFGKGFVETMGGEAEVMAWAGRLGQSLRQGVIAGALSAAGGYAMKKGEQAFGWDTSAEHEAQVRAAIKAKSDAWLSSQWQGAKNWWNGTPQHVATGADAHGGAPASPKVDTAQITEAKSVAQQAGPEIKAALDIKASPQVDTSSIKGAKAEALELEAVLKRIGGAARSAAASVSSASRSVAASSHALHDGPEAH